MAYFDGNSVTALWNFAQHYAMSDNSYDTTFGPSTPGHSTGPAEPRAPQGTRGGVSRPYVIQNAGNGQGTVIGDSQSTTTTAPNRDHVQLSADNKNIGDLLTPRA